MKVEALKTAAARLLILLLLGVTARAQSVPGTEAEPACTDLSGKIPLPCPGQESAHPAAAKLPSPTSRADARPDLKSPPAERTKAAESKIAVRPVSAPAPSVPPTSADLHPDADNSAPPVDTPSHGCTDLSGRYTMKCTAVSSESAPAPGGGSGSASSASSASIEPVAEPHPNRTVIHSPERALVGNLIADQKAIWTSPLHIRLDNAQWLIPMLGGTAVVIASDTDIQRHIPSSLTFRKHSNSFSNYGVAGFAGITGATWLWGISTHNEHMRETGVLSGEAALDSFALTYAIKSITQRDRPFERNGHGNFWSKGDSFPSEHAAAAWSVATVFAHEYPGPLTQLLAYGGAAAVSAARVTADKHFASDALVGSALGYFVGRQAYKAHHDQNIDAAYGTFERTRAAEGPRDPANMGSTYVALDSWIYSAIDRLAALGYIHSVFSGLRPWTRAECARLLQEAERQLGSDTGSTASAEAERLYRSLQAEFLVESRRLAGERNLSAELESIYTRFTGISGKPLNDSFHFGQTIINDFGRPYQEGFNMATGFTSHAEAGPLAFYVRGEYQHAPSAAAYPLNVRQAIATMDLNPVQPAVPIAAHDDFQLLDTYAALNIKNNQISFGRQSTWWGPGQGGALMFSDNALPMYMLRWTRVSPTKLPWLFGLLGPMRTDIFIGKLEGHHFPGNPYIAAQKVSFKPTPNLELGFSKLSIFAGGGVAITWHNFYKATFNYDDRNFALGDAPGFDPGDRRSEVNFSYRVPGLRDWLTLYSDALSDDDPSPLASPRRAAMNPGIYLSHVPGIPKLDLRAEAAYTDVPAGGSVGGKFIYFNTVYHDAHTNAGNIMGHWIGREGHALQLWSTYWLTPRDMIRLGYRAGRVPSDFVPGGGRLDDLSLRSQFTVRPGVELSAGVQVERWNFPLLRTSTVLDTTASFMITYRPKWTANK